MSDKTCVEISDIELNNCPMPVFGGYDDSGNEVVVYTYRLKVKHQGKSYIHPYFGPQENTLKLEFKIREVGHINLNHWHLDRTNSL
jgi:hypothetical protein